MSVDVVLCGSCVVDLPCLQVPLHQPIGQDQTLDIDPIEPTCGGITCNAGIALQRLGLSTAVLSYVGRDSWGDIVRTTLRAEGVDISRLHNHPTDPTTAVVVLIDQDGNRSFLAPGVRTATKSIDAAFVERHLAEVQQATYFLFGYLGRMPKLEPGLPLLLPKIREHGCRTVADAAGTDGHWESLKAILPALDVFIPSKVEAVALTGLQDPRDILAKLRDAGAPGILGVKLGDEGVLLDDPASGHIRLPAIKPPKTIIDTTGAGDCFMAGLLAGLHRGWDLEKAGRLGTVAGAYAVTARGGYTGVCSFDDLESILA